MTNSYLISAIESASPPPKKKNAKKTFWKYRLMKKNQTSVSILSAKHILFKIGFTEARKCPPLFMLIICTLLSICLTARLSATA